MRFSDLVHHSIENLADRRLRTGLTLAGIVIGVAALASLQSLAEGARANVLEHWKGLGTTTQLTVMPKGELSRFGRRVRPRRSGEESRDPAGAASDHDGSRAGQGQPPRPLDQAALEEIRALPGVRLVSVPILRPVTLKAGGKEAEAILYALPAEFPRGEGIYQLKAGSHLPAPSPAPDRDPAPVRDAGGSSGNAEGSSAATVPQPPAPAPSTDRNSRPLGKAGGSNSDGGESTAAASPAAAFLIGRRLAEELGFAEPEEALGAVVDASWEELGVLPTALPPGSAARGVAASVPGPPPAAGLTLARHATALEVVGVVDGTTAYLTIGPFNAVVSERTASAINPVSVESLKMLAGGGAVPAATIFLNEDAGIKAIDSRVREMGFSTRSALDVLPEIRRSLLFVQALLACLGGIALAVAALGIANTFLTAVYERTHEIGVRRAVGARRADIGGQFLFEAGLLGLAGALCGLLVAWLGSRYVATAVFTWVSQGEKVPERFYVFTPRLLAGSVAFAILISVAASLYPASRAARLNPVDSLRHE